jgi:hypothetical protein
MESNFKPLAGLLDIATMAQTTSKPEPPAYDCEICRDSKFVRSNAPFGSPMFGKAIECPGCKPRLDSIGVPDEFKGKTFADFDKALNPEMNAAFDQVLAVAKGAKWCALLSGNSGLGKTLLASIALNERWGYFWTWGALWRHIRRMSYSDDGPQVADEEAFRGWAEGQFLLVLDDIGAEMPRDPTAINSALYSILDGRYRLKLPTILTTNNSKVIEDRVLDRYRVGLVSCRGRSVRPSSQR